MQSRIRQLVLTIYLFVFFNDTATTEIYTLSLHDALPISQIGQMQGWLAVWGLPMTGAEPAMSWMGHPTTGRMPGMASPEEIEALRQASPEEARSEEHTSELQSRQYLVCRLLLEKEKARAGGQ